MISPGEVIYYLEYLDNGASLKDKNADFDPNEVKELLKNPFKLWCVGKIFMENEYFLAVISCGTIGRQPNTKPNYEIILKSAITKKEVIHVVQ